MIIFVTRNTTFKIGSCEFVNSDNVCTKYWPLERYVPFDELVVVQNPPVGTETNSPASYSLIEGI